jgi:hypothetical protein
MFSKKDTFIKDLEIHQAKLEKHYADMGEFGDTRTDAQINATQKLVDVLKNSGSKPEPFTHLEIQAINEDAGLLQIMEKHTKLVPNEYHDAQKAYDRKLATERQQNIDRNKNNPI